MFDLNYIKFYKVTKLVSIIIFNTNFVNGILIVYYKIDECDTIHLYDILTNLATIITRRFRIFLFFIVS